MLPLNIISRIQQSDPFGNWNGSSAPGLYYVMYWCINTSFNIERFYLSERGSSRSFTPWLVYTMVSHLGVWCLCARYLWKFFLHSFNFLKALSQTDSMIQSVQSAQNEKPSCHLTLLNMHRLMLCRIIPPDSIPSQAMDYKRDW